MTVIGRYKRWKVIPGFALLGLLMAGAVYAYSALRNYNNTEDAFHLSLDLASIVVCPPTLLFAMCIDCESVGWGGFELFVIEGVLNAALYAAVGAAVLSLRGDKGRR